MTKDNTNTIIDRSKLIYAAPINDGFMSPRGYTRAEIAAARRRGYVNGPSSRLNGGMFWGGGDHLPNEIRKGLADYQLLAAAIEREWHEW